MPRFVVNSSSRETAKREEERRDKREGEERETHTHFRDHRRQV
jgi:hypothetical protein